AGGASHDPRSLPSALARAPLPPAARANCGRCDNAYILLWSLSQRPQTLPWAEAAVSGRGEAGVAGGAGAASVADVAAGRPDGAGGAGGRARGGGRARAGGR